MEEGEDRDVGQQGGAKLKDEPARPLSFSQKHHDDSSFVDITKLEPDDEQHLDSLTEEEHVRAHLQDVESSFMPPTSPTIDVAGPDAGIDDTFLFDAAPRQPTTTSIPTSTSPSTLAVEAPSHSQEDPGSQAAPAQTPEEPDTNQQPTHAPPATTSPPKATIPILNSDAIPPLSSSPSAQLMSSLQPETQHSHLPSNGVGVGDEDDNHEADVTDATSTTDDFSSPTTAVAARAASRAASVATDTTAYKTPQEHVGNDAPAHEIPNADDTQDDGSFSTEDPTPSHHGSDIIANRLSSDAGATPGHALKVGKRPRYLRSRNVSQRSSASSVLASDEHESDGTIGLSADYAPQSAGAAPAFGLTRNASNTFTRSFSMGSMASGIDDGLDPLPSASLEPLEEVDSPVQEQYAADTLATPKAKRGPLNPPTDTIIARHVRNVEVPESLAKEYQTKGGLSTPLQSYRKFADYTPAHGTVARGGRNMTLKEQSNTIERLSKENFDLKLKVMFLSDRLDKLSEEGIKEMISENVELKTSLAVIQRDNKMLRRRVKELEKRYHEDEGRPSTARSGVSSDGRATPPFEAGAQANEEELYILRERIEEYEREIERLRSESMGSELEKRKLVETVKAMGDRATERVGDSLGKQEEAEVWKDLLEQETARREQADDDNRKLRDELFALKQEMNGTGSASGAMHHTTNIYNLTRKQRPTSPSRSRPVSSFSGEADPANSLSQSSTLVEELRRESEKLRHENAELRREVGAQTSMLTSRNREKERLYQEIEELKLAQRRGGQAPTTLDGLLDRSASRVGAHGRPISRGSGRSQLTAAVEDPGREELENKIAEQRDKLNEIKFKNQELQRELDSCMADFEDAVEAKRQAEENMVATQDELENTMNDLITIQAERDEALQDQAVWEGKFTDLQEEAQELVNELETEVDQKVDENERLQMDLQDRTDNFEALQEEMRSMTDALIRLEDEQAKTQRRIEQLEQELADSGKELEDLEGQLLESNEKAQRLGVQQESSQGEIAFLREEQEGDKIRIGDLEAALANLDQILTNERDRAKELDQRLADERKQRELIANREKEEVQKIVNNLNREASTAKEEVRNLRKSLGTREVEATQWKERLLELENNLREALGDLDGTRSSLLQSITALQRELESTARELDSTKSALLEKEHIVKQRDSLLETHGLESRRLNEMLEKERQSHRVTHSQFETFQRTHQHVTRTVTSQDSRIVELEAVRVADKKKIAQLEVTLKEQVAERNDLLLVLWTRLSALCGSDWTHNNSLINGRALPTIESISTMLPGFGKNLLAAIKMIEALLGNFKSRIKSVERDLWKEYQTLESNLEVRTKKLERLETLVRSGIANGNYDAQTRLSKLETEYRTLKIDHATLQRAHDARVRGANYADRSLIKKSNSEVASSEELLEVGSPSPLVPTGPHGRDSKLPRSKTTTHIETTTNRSLTRGSTVNLVTDMGRSNSSHGDTGSGSGLNEHQFQLRLRQLEYKLKEERDARVLDRKQARQRIHDSERQNAELTAELVRARKKPE
ncbi:hypothetical protein F4808DRAFT_184285 [Astrocystis sublimbata]|nr:hypothetical protein F4808DRAFT_184285 [Astrocystis sublimbata]